MTRQEQIGAALKLMKAWTTFATSPPDKPRRDAAMTRQEQVDAALALIDPPAVKCDQCRSNIEYMLDDMEAVSGSNADLKAIRAKPDARAWEAYHKALHRLLVTHDNLKAAGWRGQIERAAIKRAIQATTPQQYRSERAQFEAYACLIPFDACEQDRAVALAHELLMQWRGSKATSTTRKGLWSQLSAIFYGDPDADLYRHMRAFRIRRGRK